MNPQQTFKNKSEFGQIGQVLQKFLAYWPLFLISLTMAIAIAYIKLRAEQPVYVAYAKILLKDPSKGSKVLDEFNIMDGKQIVENEILILKSGGMMQEVVRRLGLTPTVFNEGRVRVEELYKDNSPVSFVPVRRDSIHEGGQFYFDVDWATGEVNIAEQKIAFNDTLTINRTPYLVVPNLHYNKNIVGKNYYVVFNSVENLSAQLVGDLTANAMSMTSSVIDVSINTKVPEKGVDILTKLFNVYNDYTVIDKNQTAAKTLDFIEDRLADVALQLDSIEQGVVEFRTEQAPIDLTSLSQSYFSQATQMEQQKNGVDLQLSVLANVKSYLQNGGSVPSLGAIGDPALAGLLSQLQNAEAKVQDLERTEGSKSDLLIGAKENVATLRKSIMENVANVQRTLGTTRGSYSNIMGRNNSMLRRNPQKEKAFATISRQQGVKNTIYNYLLEKREETALNSASTITDLRVLDQASTFGPVSPVPRTFYIKWLVIGLIVPAAFVFLKDLLDRKIQLRQEIEDKTDVPIIAEIAQVNTNSPIVIREGKRTAIAEQFRSLRTNLTFMGLNEQSNTILVTSSMSGEGKSFLAINLAISLTLIGKKVALLELDLRKPKVSKLLQLANHVGISNYLVNQVGITEIIKPTEINDLFVVPSGVIPPNPAELIQLPKFAQFMKEVKERFDYVIIDSAPVGPVADAYLLKDHADTTIFLMRQNKTQRIYLKLLNEISQKKRFKNMCIVLNGVKKAGFSYGSSSYWNAGSNGGGYYVSENNDDIRLFGRIKRTLGIKS